MPHQVNGAFLRAPCPVPSCPAYEPNSGSVLSSVSTKAYSSRGADIVMQSSGFEILVSSVRNYDLGLVRNSQVHTIMTADAATINSAQMKVT
jgi:hypothetical protein